MTPVPLACPGVRAQSGPNTNTLSRSAVKARRIRKRSHIYSTPSRMSEPTSVLSAEFSECIDLCGLPQSIKDIYVKEKNIKQLYEWQKECLSDSRILRGNLKCFEKYAQIIEFQMLMLREAIVKRRSSILVLPYVAIVQEKIVSLSIFEDVLGIKVEEYAANKGRIPPIRRRKSVSIFVATIEKANNLVNSLIETNQLDRIGLLVIDELHMIGDGSRGAVIEQIVCKVVGSGQIIGMSATLSNIDELASFLRGYVYSTAFRPIELNEFVRIGQSMWKVLPTGELELNAELPANSLSKVDPDGLCQLLVGVIPQRSVLIFCPTKKNCESVAAMISRIVPKSVRKYRLGEKRKILEAMKEDCEGNDGIVCVICATSTLAAGVNMPARRVIIKSPMVGCNPISKAQYLQMIGRAGRAGFDSKGDSITIVRPGFEEKQFRDMLSSPVLSCSSGLTNMERLSSFVLDLVTLKIADSLDSLCDALTYSFLHSQIGYVGVRKVLTQAVDKLKNDRLLVEDDQELLFASQLGVATFAANLSPLEAHRLFTDLTANLCRGLVFSSHFHLLFTIAPYDAVCTVDWDLFHTLYVELADGEKELLSFHGISESVILQYIVMKKKLKAGEPGMRLYIGLLLQEIWKQQPHALVANRFGVERGWLQNTLQSAVSQAASIAKFAEKLTSLWPLRLLLPELVHRLSDCLLVELIPLMSIDGVKRGRARQLYAAGYKNVAKVARADYKDLMENIPNLSRFSAMRMVNSAKAILRDQFDEKIEELDAIGLEFREISDRISF
ncbi:helicase protein [Dictyocaulus viviparus]|uniref:Helicase protein n=1 Tax=Dictyocaulus viviparus TaxID=29172 RepID=A0A0D8XDA9_DICVI|nr:helicase protein [Dictyocaulus viviparus]